jgi:FkbM family methyltransferase
MKNRTRLSAGTDWRYLEVNVEKEEGYKPGRDDFYELLRKQMNCIRVPCEPAVLQVLDEIDGFHILRTVLETRSPQVCISGYNSELSSEVDLVAPCHREPRPESNRWGASLMANVKLASAFGYSLLACDPLAYRVVLIRTDLADIGEESIKTKVDGAHLEHEPDAGFLTSEHYLLKGVETMATEYGWISYFKNDQYIGEHLRRGSYWQEPLVRKAGAALVEASGLALDIGAHVGTHSIGIARLATQLSIVCFEPQRSLYLLLQRNICENSLQHRIFAACCAVGHRTMQASMNRYSSDGSAAGAQIEYGSDLPVNLGGIQLGVGGQACGLVCVDDLTITNLVYVKIDAEGAEPLVIEGMQETLKRELPILVFEDRDDRRLSDDIRRLLSAEHIHMGRAATILRQQGYSVHKWSTDSIAIPCA